MDVVHLRYFLAVARELSFTNAAQDLHVSTPALSQRIRTLERQLGERLFDRSTHHVALTSAGRRLVPLAETVVANFDSIPQRLVAQEQGETVRISFPYALSAKVRECLHSVLTALSARYVFTLEHVPSAGVDKRLLERRIDVAMSHVRPASSQLKRLAVGSEQFGVLADASLFPGRQSLRLADLDGLTYIHGPDYWEIDEMRNAQQLCFDSGAKNAAESWFPDLPSMFIALRGQSNFSLCSLETNETYWLDPEVFRIFPVEDMPVRFQTFFVWLDEEGPLAPLFSEITDLIAPWSEPAGSV